MRLIISLLIACMIAAPVTVYADPCIAQTYTDESKPPNFDCPGPGEEQLVYPKQAAPAVGVKKEQKVPFDGVLLTTGKAQRLGSRVTALRRLRHNDTITAQKKLAAELKLQESIRQAKEDLLKARSEDYKKQVQHKNSELLEANKWYRSFTFGLIVGIVVTTGAAAGVGYAIK
jgi:hypothetical protein